MAKRGGQLHIDVSNDEEWEKLLLRDGLIVVDVYSDWCGPCTGMAANLKKIKLEIGGDMLVLALAKCDNITALERFRFKSEPTWMFISKGQKTNLIFGANAPEITRVLIDEINKERRAVDAGIERPERTEITELHDIELGRYQESQLAIKLAREKEEAKKIKNIRDRKTNECRNILNNLSLGVILIFPCARDRYTDCINDFLKEASCTLVAQEKTSIDVDMLEEMFYFYEDERPPFDEPSLNNLLSNKSVVVAVKGLHGADTSDWDLLLRRIVYGRETLGPPGDRFSFYQKMQTEIEDEETGEVQILTGVWVPRQAYVRATMLRMFFPKYAQDLEIPDPGPLPPHYAMVFETDKIKSALTIISKWPKQILHYGFFTKEDPEDTELVAKSVQRLEMPAYRDKRTYEEKLVFAVSKKKSELILDLIQLGPLYMSTTTDDGKRDTDLFFADDYADSLPDEEKIYLEKEEEEEDEGEETEESPTA